MADPLMSTVAKYIQNFFKAALLGEDFSEVLCLGSSRVPGQSSFTTAEAILFRAVLHNGQACNLENVEAHRSALHDQAVQDWHKQDHGQSWSLLNDPELSALPSFESDMGPWPQLDSPAHEPLPDLEDHPPHLDLPPISSAFPLESIPGEHLQKVDASLQDWQVRKSVISGTEELETCFVMFLL